MNTLALSILWALVRTGIVLSLSAVAVAAFLRAVPRRLTHRAANSLRRRPAARLAFFRESVRPPAAGIPLKVGRAGRRVGPASQASAGPPLAGEKKIVSGKERNKRTLLPLRVSSLLSTIDSSGCHWRELWPASVFGSSSTGPHEEDVRAISEIHDPLTLETRGRKNVGCLSKEHWRPKVRPWRTSGTRTRARRHPLQSRSISCRQTNGPSPGLSPSSSLWATGIAFIAGRSAWAYVRFVRRFPASRETPPDWADEWTSLQLEAGLPGSVPLVVAEHAGPVLCRLPRGYRLIVPADAWRTLEPSQRLLILRHELAHIERHDVWKSLAMRILALPHWFNPLVWRIVRRFDESAEWACDEAAAGAAPERVPDYARALLQLSHRAQPAFFATSAARSAGLALPDSSFAQSCRKQGNQDEAGSHGGSAFGNFTDQHHTFANAGGEPADGRR